MSKKQIENILRSIFSLFIMIATAGGAMAFLLFIVAMVLGGKAGEQLAIDIGKIYLPYFIKAASVAVFSGLALFYLTKAHPLSLKTEIENKTDKSQAG